MARAGAYAHGADPILDAGSNALAAGPRALPAVISEAARAGASTIVVTAPAHVPDWATLKGHMLDALGGEVAVRAWRKRRLEGTSEIIGVPMS